MDPKVCGKLLTHHRRGYGVDVGALRDQCPSGRTPEKAPRWDLTGTEGCSGGKVVLWLPGCFQGIRVYIGERSRSVELRGAHEGGGAPTPLGAPSYFVASLNYTPSLLDCICSKKDHPEGFIPFGFYLVFLFCKTQNRQKNRNWHWASG